ncbi:probable pre-mRNA-splicing factor ATP-dependent RNA helicase DEAH5 [Corylus avellana]|uniref:probable pre-mRNA-splicing factor ATP-dependent RNA helicase DEAH5 n=1 Tax=Corylus avellana TaxID=13451 RepID=UPI00286A41E1|nr:probable pre-mRNA-splicing factor ATP-dependent RNA helicase DEAH5 [Corylus avellana]
MGMYLSAPKTEKASQDGENDRLRYGLSSMQGWRATMEDAERELERERERSTQERERERVTDKRRLTDETARERDVIQSCRHNHVFSPSSCRGIASCRARKKEELQF